MKGKKDISHMRPIGRTFPKGRCKFFDFNRKCHGRIKRHLPYATLLNM